MKLHHDPETDSLDIERSPRLRHEAREISKGVTVDLDAAGAVVGLDIDHASRKLDLTTLETIALPITSTRAA